MSNLRQHTEYNTENICRICTLYVIFHLIRRACKLKKKQTAQIYQTIKIDISKDIPSPAHSHLRQMSNNTAATKANQMIIELLRELVNFAEYFDQAETVTCFDLYKKRLTSVFTDMFNVLNLHSNLNITKAYRKWVTFSSALTLSNYAKTRKR